MEIVPESKRHLLAVTVCRGLPDDEVELFRQACNNYQLDPFTGQINALKRWDKVQQRQVLSIQTGIHGLRAIADRTCNYAPGKPTEYTMKGVSVTSATAHVKKRTEDGTWHEVSETAYWDEYVATDKAGKPTFAWQKMGHVMLGKCAEALALRRAFPAQLAGLYVPEEMDTSTTPPPQQEAPRPARDWQAEINALLDRRNKATTLSEVLRIKNDGRHLVGEMDGETRWAYADDLSNFGGLIRFSILDQLQVEYGRDVVLGCMQELGIPAIEAATPQQMDDLVRTLKSRGKDDDTDDARPGDGSTEVAGYPGLSGLDRR